MAVTLQFRRGTAAEAAAFVGAPGELFYDIENKIMYVHDGITPGGKETGITDHTLMTGRDAADQHPQSAITGLVDDLGGKQATLVSSENIKTINSTSILGEGNIVIEGGDVTLTGTQTLTNKTVTNLILDGSVTEEIFALSGTELNSANGTIQTKTIASPTTFTDALVAGQSLVLMLTGAGSHTITWPTTTWISATGNAPPTLTANDVVVFWKVSTTLHGLWSGSYATV